MLVYYQGVTKVLPSFGFRILMWDEMWDKP